MKPNTSPRVRSLASRAFTMLELVVVLALLVLMAGVLAPIVLQSKKEAQAAKILGVTDALRQACERFYADNGRYPSDTTGTGPSALHELSENDSSLPNWKGPYLLAPLNKADNPLGGAIKVINSLTAASITPPFPSLSGAGATAIFYGLDEEVALLVNMAIDGSEGSNWKTLGTVTFKAATQGIQSYNLGTSGNIQQSLGEGTGEQNGSSSSSSGGGSGSGSGSSGGGVATTGNNVGGATFVGQKAALGSSPSALNIALSAGS